MKGFVSILSGALFLAAPTAFGAGTNAATQRTYTSRIQMHQAPSTLRVPNRNLDDGTSLTEGLVPESEMTPAPEIDLTPYVPTQVTPVRPEKKKPKNWIKPPTPEDLKESGAVKKDDGMESGWGELADDVKQRQDSAQDKALRKETEEDTEDGAPMPGQRADKDKDRTDEKGEKDKTSSSLKLNNEFEPLGSERVVEDRKQDERQLDRAVENDNERQDSVKKDSAGADRKQDKPETRDVTERRFGADTKWNSDQSWDRKGGSENPLRQTTQLLAPNGAPGLSIGRGVGGLPTMSSQLATPSLPAANSAPGPSLGSAFSSGKSIGGVPAMDSKMSSGFETPFSSGASMPQPISTGGEGLRGTPGIPSTGTKLIGSMPSSAGSMAPFSTSQSGQGSKIATDPWQQ